jgi:hypothetical protein
MKEKLIAIINKMEENDLKDLLGMLHEEGTMNADLWDELHELYKETFFTK